MVVKQDIHTEIYLQELEFLPKLLQCFGQKLEIVWQAPTKGRDFHLRRHGDPRKSPRIGSFV